jgi:hypothetical protein
MFVSMASPNFQQCREVFTYLHGWVKNQSVPARVLRQFEKKTPSAFSVEGAQKKAQQRK